ncbi:acetyltransferase [Kordiimonas lacus]|uniref:Putative acetyltransferase n=1 Tax=Kordiimonas lacus TaxID=637679 RepID=A0A1G6VRC5_9PROT|nr:acetyltransferase [Kordiimonas lacus]SDD55396.1 putative acetyltransferase [Kordiimonas lacus]
MTFRQARATDHARLFDIWHAAVVATHHFLSEADLAEIAGVVKDQYLPNADFSVFADASDRPLGFMGCTDNNIDALFIDPAAHGQGIGKQFIAKMKELFDTVTVQVNEQQPQAHAFYKACGFVDVRRDPLDDAGRPFPIIHMAWRKAS